MTDINHTIPDARLTPSPPGGDAVPAPTHDGQRHAPDLGDRSGGTRDRAETGRPGGRRSRGGPRTPEGKARSSLNALKHGMTARTPVLPGECPDEFRQRVDDFFDAVQPRDAVEAELAEQAAIASWKMGRADRCEAARLAAAVRAEEAEAGPRRLEEVAVMGRWLVADSERAKMDTAEPMLPLLAEERRSAYRGGRGDPLHIAFRLEATADGCRWLLDRWAELRGGLERQPGGCWPIAGLIAAIQLMGRRPLELDAREWQGLLDGTAADPARLREAERGLLRQLVGGLVDDPAGRRAALLRLVEREAARLGEREAACRRREAADRSELADRLAVDTTPEGERMRRYHADCDRKLHRALNSLLKLRRGEAVGVAGGGAPAPDPSGPSEPESGPVDGPDGAGEVGSPPELAAPPAVAAPRAVGIGSPARPAA